MWTVVSGSEKTLSSTMECVTSRKEWQGRVIAFQKCDGGVRGIVAGDVLRLVARTIAQQLTNAVEAYTPPFQPALSTRAGCECIAHALQVSDLNPGTTITSIDGVAAFDFIQGKRCSRNSARCQGGVEVMPFVLVFCGSSLRICGNCACPSTKARGANRRSFDASSFRSRQLALVVAQSRLESDKVMAFLDDVFVGKGHAVVQHELFHHAKIQII